MSDFQERCFCVACGKVRLHQCSSDTQTAFCKVCANRISVHSMSPTDPNATPDPIYSDYCSKCRVHTTHKREDDSCVICGRMRSTPVADYPDGASDDDHRAIPLSDMSTCELIAEVRRLRLLIDSK